jgi:XTP/dITP diphosphohydrolase
MLRIIFATTNKGKISELGHFINIPELELVSLNDLPGAPFPEAIENGKSFGENALLKARHYFDFIREPLIADDSGLIVPALDGQPGILSARYAGEKASDLDNNLLLLRNLNSVVSAKRDAYFKAVIIYKDHTSEITFEGICKGLITNTPVGDKGFGYDPLFFLPEAGKTFGQMNPQEKNLYSHRGKAVNQLRNYLKMLKK